ncbi:MAG: hypothetical protein HY703_10275 [Gemmatimonadetes bacterium]|nr:hypothetical protein [Gemmatimonadota bacterium]
MQVKLALLADYANITAEGKLNILGVFDRIAVSELPAVHPQMQFILRLEAHPAERDRSHSVELRLHDPDGETVFHLNGEIVPRGGKPGQALASNQIISINNLQLAKTGEYTFVVFVDNDLKAEVPLAVEQLERGRLEPPQAPADGPA